MSANVAELVAAEFEVTVAGGPERFKERGWFAVGLTEAECPRCRSRLQGYRMPYNPKPGLTYHYWALVCLKCKRLFEPANISVDSRRRLQNFSGHPTKAAGVGGGSRTHSRMRNQAGSLQRSVETQETAGAGNKSGVRQEIDKLKDILESKGARGHGKGPDTPGENNPKQRSEEGSAGPARGGGNKDEVTPFTTGWGNTPPSRKLAEKIVALLVGERLLTEQHGKRLLSKLAEGKMQPGDWRLPIELSDPEED